MSHMRPPVHVLAGTLGVNLDGIWYTNDTHYHRLQAWETYGRKQGTLVNKSNRGPEHYKF